MAHYSDRFPTQIHIVTLVSVRMAGNTDHFHLDWIIMTAVPKIPTHISFWTLVFFSRFYFRTHFVIILFFEVN
jgi:hypothetical protein